MQKIMNILSHPFFICIGKGIEIFLVLNLIAIVLAIALILYKLYFLWEVVKEIGDMLYSALKFILQVIREIFSIVFGIIPKTLRFCSRNPLVLLLLFIFFVFVFLIGGMLRYSYESNNPKPTPIYAAETTDEQEETLDSTEEEPETVEEDPVPKEPTRAEKWETIAKVIGVSSFYDKGGGIKGINSQIYPKYLLEMKTSNKNGDTNTYFWIKVRLDNKQDPIACRGGSVFVKNKVFIDEDGVRCTYEPYFPYCKWVTQEVELPESDLKYPYASRECEKAINATYDAVQNFLTQ